MTGNRCRTVLAVLAVLAVFSLTAGCGGNNIASKTATPGEGKTTTTKALEMGANLLQSKPPIDVVNSYLDGFHFHPDDMGRQMEAHHYCAQLSEDFIQCVLFDGNTRDAKLVGVEYVVSAKLFAGLPAEEKRLWHSHRYEVASGQLVAPGIPNAAEHALMEKLVSTYGKIWHTWDTEKNPMPVGIPALLMGFTRDGQLRPELLKTRDDRIGVTNSEKRQNRQDIPAPEVDPEADSWQKGTAPMLRLDAVPVRPAK